MKSGSVTKHRARKPSNGFPWTLDFKSTQPILSNADVVQHVLDLFLAQRLRM